MLHTDERVAVFIDAANNYNAFEDTGLKLDYKILRDQLTSKCNLVTLRYYSGISSEPRFKHIKSKLDWLSYNGYVVVTKPIKIMPNNNPKANMDVEIAVDAILICQNIDHVILFTGDGDFTYLVQEIQKCGVKVSIVSAENQTADDLKRQADHFYDIELFMGSI